MYTYSCCQSFVQLQGYRLGWYLYGLLLGFIPVKWFMLVGGPTVQDLRQLERQVSELLPGVLFDASFGAVRSAPLRNV